MLLDKFYVRKEDDRYYFLINYFVRCWIIFNFLIFSPPIFEIVFEKSFSWFQVLISTLVLFPILTVEGTFIVLKARKMEKEDEKERLEAYGPKNYF